MANDRTELAEGNWVVHAMHGLGQITGRDTKEVLGEKKQFYVIKTDLITYWLPVENKDTQRIRPIASGESFQEAIKLISSEPVKLDDNFRRRLIHIKDQISKCSLEAKAQLIRDIHARDLQKDIHINEKKILENLISQFLEEWQESTGIDTKAARQQLNDALKKSCVNLKPKKTGF